MIRCLQDCLDGEVSAALVVPLSCDFEAPDLTRFFGSSDRWLTPG